MLSRSSFAINPALNEYSISAAVIGVPDDILGYTIKAFVTLKRDSKITEEGILLYCSKHLENYMVPKYIEIRQQLPKTITGKIEKKGLI